MIGAGMNGVWPLITSGGPTGLLALFVGMVFFGWLVPRQLYRDRMADKDKLIDTLTEALTAERANSALLRVGNHTAVKLLDAAAENVSGRDDHRSSKR